ncbi:MAG TPA: M13 family metallopeptidase [Steroidobacteraceae bacterium]|nr:M13 family metallopeptidase [Steroidobacteraceae bacterium]
MSRTYAFLLAAALTCSSTGSAEAPFTQLPYTPSLDLNAMDRSVDPCDDFYTYACGGWQKRNPIPADQSSWSVYRKLNAEMQQYVWGILVEAAKPVPGRTAIRQRIGDYFAACMDEKAIEAKGLSPLQPTLTRIEGIKNVSELPQLLGVLHASMFTGGLLFNSGSQQDARDASKVITGVYAGGLGLPDRDYYLKDDDRSKDTRARYQQHVAKMFELAGASAMDAAARAQAVMRIETSLAQASLSRVDQRDPYKIYHRVTLAELQKETPRFDWKSYFASVGFKPEPWINNAEPKFMVEMNRLLTSESLADLKTYLRWGVLDAQAPYLSKAFVDQDFAFYSAYMRGVPEQRPRWKKCVSWVDRDLGEALGKEFVDKTFPPSTKTQTLKMTQQIQEAMKVRIEQLDWMSPDTKQQALVKLQKMRNKIGYPDRWRDYSALTVELKDFYGNVTRATDFEVKRQAAKVGKPVDRNEWAMTPITVNAYYDPGKNDMNFPAAVLMPPLFDPKMDDAPNYANTGGTIGHELTHGFDDEGRQYDGDGNLNDWWQKKDAEEFERRAQCVRNQYKEYTIIDDIKINSELSSGEDIADLGGLIIAWIAWQEQTKNQRLQPINGLTPAQRFFVGFAQWDCANHRPEDLRVSAVVNPHSPPKYRINGVVVNMPEFAQAFECKAGKKLVKKSDEVCRIW